MILQNNRFEPNKIAAFSLAFLYLLHLCTVHTVYMYCPVPRTDRMDMVGTQHSTLPCLKIGHTWAILSRDEPLAARLGVNQPNLGGLSLLDTHV
jgi:hypothetical protein